MNMNQTMDRQAPEVGTFVLGEDLLVFAEPAQQFYRLNGTAAHIWCALEDGLTPEGVVRELMQVYRIARATAENAVADALAQWEEVGLRDTVPSGRRAPQDRPEPLAPIAPAVPRTETRGGQVLSIRILGLDYRIWCADSRSMEMVRSVFGHLEASGPCSGGRPVHVLKKGRGYAVIWVEELLASGLSLDEVAPVLHAQAMWEAYQQTPGLLVMHAAAISDGARCVLMPAVSGSGKSTLSAYLASTGLPLCADELVILDGTDGCLRPVPLSIGLKPGAWPVLDSVYPGLERLPIHRRGDGRRVRYLPPSMASPAALTSAKVAPVALVFPRYAKGSPLRISELDAADALCRLADAGYDTPSGQLTTQGAAELVNWIGGLKGFELEYEDLEGAGSFVKELLSHG